MIKPSNIDMTLWKRLTANCFDFQSNAKISAALPADDVSLGNVRIEETAEIQAINNLMCKKRRYDSSRVCGYCGIRSTNHNL